MSRLFVAWVILVLGFIPAAAEPLRIVTLGDSITKGVRPGVKPEESFAALVQSALIQNGIEAQVINVGIGGERADQAIGRLQRAVIERKPHIVTIMYGTNDSYIDLGKTESRISAEAYRTHLSEIVTELKKSGIQPVLMTEPAWAEGVKKNGINEEPNVSLAPYMDVCRAVARELDVPLVDHFAHWTAAAKKGTKLIEWTTDACHPNPRGHQELAHRIVQTLLPLAQRLADEYSSWKPETRFKVSLETASTGYDGQMCWVHPRAAAIPGTTPTVVLTMQKLLLAGSDVFYALNDTITKDFGRTWSKPLEHTDTLGRRDEANGVIVAACDFTPKWHAKTGTLLGIGHTVRYQNNRVVDNRRRETCWSIFNEKSRTWAPWIALPMPDEPKFYNAGAGSVQRVDLPNGDILLPIYFKGEQDKTYRVTVLRCRFDGQTLKFVEQGTELALDSGRGLYEPSLTKHGNRYFLALRNDTAGYIAVSDDGLHFSEPKTWKWDDGTDLGNYNTQQHWVQHSDALHLVYTRKGANNDHVFRHRAPLFIAEVNPADQTVIRSTERILVPEYGARLGNFGVTQVNENETWVTVAEWMQTWSPDIVIKPDNSYGATNRVWAARIRWSKPNQGWNMQ